MSIVSDYSDGIPSISYCLTTFDGDVIAESGADTPVYAASTIKLAVLIAALRAVDAGRLRLSQQLTSRLTFHSSAPGGGTFSFERMWCVPNDVGYIPVIIPLRLGAQTGPWVKARVKRAPSLARRSRFGVWTNRLP